ncbi:MAG: hypothetical protein EA345_04515 [Halomonas sp.]|nr:hypothetical protein [Halomonas sp.]TVP50616.1 MAG: hypothetical protein EA345_04515 [Halomonas sp.]
MDKHDHMMSEQRNAESQGNKRSRLLTFFMMATAASVIVLAGCGDNEEVAPPAEDTAPLEQEPGAEPAPGMDEDPAMGQDPAMEQDPGLEDDQGAMPDDTMDEPMDPEDEAGFGEGTDPMPGADEDDEETTVN